VSPGSSVARRLRGIVGQTLAGRQHRGDEQDDWLGTKIAPMWTWVRPAGSTNDPPGNVCSVEQSCSVRVSVPDFTTAISAPSW